MASAHLLFGIDVFSSRKISSSLDVVVTGMLATFCYEIHEIATTLALSKKNWGFSVSEIYHEKTSSKTNKMKAKTILKMKNLEHPITDQVRDGLKLSLKDQ